MTIASFYLGSEGKVADEADMPDMGEPTSFGGKMRRFWFHTKVFALRDVNQDVFDIIDNDPIVKEMHENAESFDRRAEIVFGYLQVGCAVGQLGRHAALRSLLSAFLLRCHSHGGFIVRHNFH